jgi:hypothetical protein
MKSGLLAFDFNGEIRASVFAHAAADAGIRVGGIGDVVLIQSQDLFGAEMHANAAPFAPAALDMMGF